MGLLVMPRLRYSRKMHQLLTDFIDEQPDWEASTGRWYKNRIERFLIYLADEGIEIEQIEYRHFNKYLGLLKKKKLSWGYRTGTYQSVSKFWSWLSANDHIDDDFFKSKADLVKRPRKPKNLFKMVKVEVAKDLICTAIRAAQQSTGQLQITAIRDSAIMSLLLTTGLRREEIVDLDLSGIDFESLDGGTEVMSLFVRGKFDRERHQYTSDKITISLVKLWIAHRRAAKGEKALFTVLHRNRFGNVHTRLSVRNINQRMFFWRKKAGYDSDVYVSPHGWRHLYATLFAESGGSAFQLQKLLGHSQVSTTAIYVHMAQGQIKDAAHEHAPKLGLGADLVEGINVNGKVSSK